MKEPNPQKRRAKRITKLFEKSKEEFEQELERHKLLLTEEKGEIVVESDIDATWKAKQRDIIQDADDSTRAKVLNLDLKKKYVLKYTKNGRHMVLGGENGHLAVVDVLRSHIITDVQLENEVVHAVTPLHNESLFAACQKKYLYIYDHTGTEIHQLRSHIEPRRVEFLPYHFLLASIGRSSRLVYQDVSTGELVASIRTRMGPCSVLAQNPASAVLATGYSQGTVAMWAPTNGDALVKVLCHTAPITAVSFDRTGLKMVTTALDGKISIWDVRNLGEQMNSYRVRPPRTGTCLSISDTGLVAVGTTGGEVTIWKDILKEEKQADPYLSYKLPSGTTSNCLEFRPYEDILGIGYSKGIQTIIVPGAGEANYDTYEANPYERKTQRRENEIKRLLDKLPAETIGLEKIGGIFATGVEKNQKKTETDSLVLGDYLDEPKTPKAKKEKKKMKGRSRIGNKLKVKHRNIITIEREKRRATAEEENKKATKKRNEIKGIPDVPGVAALERLTKKSRKA